MSKPWQQRSYAPVKAKAVTVLSNTNPAQHISEYELNPAVGHQVLSCGHERELDGFSPAGTLTLCHEEHESAEPDAVTAEILSRPVPGEGDNG
jgi:hypothetical protein